METINSIKITVSAICAALTALWGWFGWLVILWIFCMVADYATGSAAALKQGKWSSSAAREGIWHKMGAVVVVVIAAVLDAVIRAIIVHFPIITLPFDYSILLCPLVVVWLILTELGSLAENAGALGAKIPGFLRKAIEALNDKVEGAGDIGNDK